MVVQAIALLDDLDKEINIYAMRVKVRFLKEHI
jgi:RNA processing factor Prp31